MDRKILEEQGIYDVSNAYGSQIYLIVGSKKTAVVDTGMAYSTEGLLDNIRDILKGRPLDYILLTHSHYDHISGIPAMKRVWPKVEVFGGAYVKHVFESPKAKKLIEKLNREAEKLYHGTIPPDFDTNVFTVDHVISEGSRIRLGNHTLIAYDTPGHTRDSMAFLMDGTYLFASETTCIITDSGTYIPNYLVSYKASEESIKKCAALPMRYVLVPHSAPYDLEEKPDFWKYCMQEMAHSKDVVLEMHEKGATVDEIVEVFESLYRDEDVKREQPLEAFIINQKSMIGAVLREFAEA